MSNIKLFSSSSNFSLASDVAYRLGINLNTVQLKKSRNGEISFHIEEIVRDQDVYILQSFHGNVNLQLMEVLLMVQACNLGAASKVTVIIPYFPYAKQDETDTGEFIPVTGELVANMLWFSRANQIIAMDPHSHQMEGFDIPMIKLSPEIAMLEWIKENVPDLRDCCIVSPNKDGARRAMSIADRLNVEFAVIHKERPDPFMENLFDGCINEISCMVGNVKGRTAIIIDDMADTCDLLVNAANKLKEVGAGKVYAIVTHGTFSDSALSLINDACFETVAVTNTIPQKQHMEESPKIQCIDISKILADAIQIKQM